jgi:hypothetical protein
MLLVNFYLFEIRRMIRVGRTLFPKKYPPESIVIREDSPTLFWFCIAFQFGIWLMFLAIAGYGLWEGIKNL